ncbi:MAG: hypothetical protein QM687_06790 [Ferruginibacter sp.]
MNPKLLADFYEGGIFHVFNRTNNRELLFISDENRAYFLKQFAKYLQPFLETFCWCLLPNHFHFLVRVREHIAITEHLDSIDHSLLRPIERKYLAGEVSAELLLEFEWKRFFTSYSMAFNKKQQRKGNLFHRPFKRVHIDNDDYFTQAVIYIHANPAKHNICSDFSKYKWSSWMSALSSKPTLLSREELIEWFGGIEKFIGIHQSQTQYYYDTAIAIED